MFKNETTAFSIVYNYYGFSPGGVIYTDENGLIVWKISKQNVCQFDKLLEGPLFVTNQKTQEQIKVIDYIIYE